MEAGAAMAASLKSERNAEISKRCRKDTARPPSFVSALLCIVAGRARPDYPRTQLTLSLAWGIIS